MNDATMRTAERHAETDPDAHRATLVARLRAGQLQERWLRLAAYAGDEGAREILGLDTVHDFTSGASDESWRRCHEVPDGCPTTSPEHAPGSMCLDRSLAEFVEGLTIATGGGFAVVYDHPTTEHRDPRAQRLDVPGLLWPDAIPVVALGAAEATVQRWADTGCILCLGGHSAQARVAGVRGCQAHRPHDSREVRIALEMARLRVGERDVGQLDAAGQWGNMVMSECPMAALACYSVRVERGPLDQATDWGPGAALEALRWVGRFTFQGGQTASTRPRLGESECARRREGHAIHVACGVLRSWALAPGRP